MSTRFSRADSAEIWTHLNTLDDDIQTNADAIATTGEDVVANAAAIAGLDVARAAAPASRLRRVIIR